MAEFTMPSLGADMDAGTITEWRVGPGDLVHWGDIVAVVETDKADVDVEVFQDGVIVELLVPTGLRVSVGTPLARITTDAGATVAPAPAPAPAPAVGSAAVAIASAAAVAPAAVAAAPVPVRPLPAAVAVAPVVGPLLRHLADERHVDLVHLHGSGPGGRITRDDVATASTRRRTTPRARRLAREHGIGLDSVKAPPGAPVRGEDVLSAVEGRASTASASPQQISLCGQGAPSPLSEHKLTQSVPAATLTVPMPAPTPGAGGGGGGLVERRREAIARLMARSAAEIPHYYVATVVSLGEAMSWLADHNAQVPIAERLLPAALLLKAAARAAAAVPELNGHWIDGFRPAETVNLGVAVSMRGGGLLTPTIRDAAAKDVVTVMHELRDLVTRSRTGRLKAQELTDATITVTNLGERGVREVFGVIVPPQVALVGIGAIHDEPWAQDGMLGIRPVVHVSLAADHRATDGLVGARFLDAMNDALQHPEVL